MKNDRVTEALGVAQQITAIRAALHRHGYRTRKRARQPVWTIYVSDDNFYQLSYQPAPISNWVLYPQNHHLQSEPSTSRQTLEKIIQNAISKQSKGIIQRAS